MKYFLLLLFVVSSFVLDAQIIRESDLRYKMDVGAQLMDQGKYDSAQVLFRTVLQNMEKLPSDMAYYFGRNSYHLRKYKQSINWLNKYIQLKGSKGRFYEASVKYLQFAEEEYLTIQRNRILTVEESFQSNDYDCDGLEKMLCPVCHGSGVIISTGLFDEQVFRTCPYSLGEGFITCEEYNLFMQGLLEPKIKE